MVIILESNDILIIIGCIIIFWIIGKVFSVPLKAIFRLIINSILGGVLIVIINSIGNIFNFHIGLNLITSILVGILGIPRSNFISYFKTIYLNFIYRPIIS